MVYALFFFILLGWGLNAFLKEYELHNVKYKRRISQTVVEIDEEFQITTILENNKFLPVTFLRVEEKFPARLTYKFKADIIPTLEYVLHKTTFLLKPYERVSRTYTVTAKQRGKYIFKDVTLIGGDVLGLNTFNKEVELNQEIVVLPKPLPLKEHIRPYGEYYGDFSVQRWIIDDPVIMTGVREYTGLEPERTIHWPSSLRTGRLMVKKFDYTTETSVMIIVNIECHSPFWFNIDQQKIEKCISLARGAVDEFEEAGIPYGLCSNSSLSSSSSGLDIKNPGIGSYHYSEVVDILGRMPYSPSLCFEDLLGNFTKAGWDFSTYVLITPAVLEPYINGINRLSEKAAKTVLVALDEENFEHLAGSVQSYYERKE